jgi:DNA adenine methylase
LRRTEAGGGASVPRLTRPVLRYHGGKWRLAPWIIEKFPSHEVYVEPFGGGGSVLFRKAPARIEVWNDIDRCVVNLFRVLRNPVQAEELRRVVELTPFSRAEYKECWAPSPDPVEDARRLIVRSFQSIGASSGDTQSGWRKPYLKSARPAARYWADWPSLIPEFVERLRQVTVEEMDWREVLNRYDDPKTLFYIDPPYILDTRDRRYGKVYVREMTTEDHRELLERIQSLQGMVVLSGYPHPIYADALRGWECHEVEARAQTNSRRTEALWLNEACRVRLGCAA